MSRPPKCRRICVMPPRGEFGPLGCNTAQAVSMAVDEYETIRLIDLLGYTQEECARQMGVARTTIQLSYDRARHKLARMLAEGIRLRISGGDYRLCPRTEICRGRACRRLCQVRCSDCDQCSLEDPD